MKRPKIRWPATVAEARKIQQRLAPKVETRDRFGALRHVAGTDVGFTDRGRTARAAVVVLRFPELTRVDEVVIEEPVRFPYVPGYLSFREIPALLKALARLKVTPDLIACDGQGYAHPRRFGLASHLGVLTGIPTIGVAKSRLIGTHRQPAKRKGAWMPLKDGDEVIGAVLRTRKGIKPLFVSIGHRVSLESAIELTLALTTRYRLPETTRTADQLASRPNGWRAT